MYVLFVVLYMLESSSAVILFSGQLVLNFKIGNSDFIKYVILLLRMKINHKILYKSILMQKYIFSLNIFYTFFNFDPNPK